MIPYGRQDISRDDIDAVVKVLHSDFLTQGPAVPQFERAVAKQCGAINAVAVSNATAALHIACLALDLGPGDLLWTSPNTFVASANCALYCGAKVDFVDIDPLTYNLSVECLSKKLAAAERLGKLPKIVIPVHLCGQSCDMASIYALSQKYGFRIIEDASHAIGGKYQNESIGNCRYSDITVFSFHPVKIITTGEGGIALTNNLNLAERMQQYRSHGTVNDIEKMQSRPIAEIWNYQQIRLGYNYRMTDIQAALGVSQLNRLEEFITKRHSIAQRYNDNLADLPLLTPFQHPDSFSSYHLYPVRLDLSGAQYDQKAVYQALQSSGIGVNVHYIPVYRHPYYEAMGFEVGYCPESELYYKECLSLPIYPNLSEECQDRVIECLRDTLKK